MNNTEYLNEEKYQTAKKKIIRISLIILIAGLLIGAALEDLGKGLRSQVGTIFSTKQKGVRYLEMAEGYILEVGVKDGEPIGYKFVQVGKMIEDIKSGKDPKKAYEDNIGTYGRFEEADQYIDPRKQ